MDSKRRTYGLIGRGRLARHLGFYLPLHGHRCLSWSRGQEASRLNAADTLLILTPDDEIERFLATAPKRFGLSFDEKRLIHCSGRVFSKLAYGCHPLQSFGNELYDPLAYQRIPFILDEDAPDFSELFPNLPNPSLRIPREKKAIYHASLTMAANFSQILWQSAFENLQRELGLDRALVRPLLEQVLQNSLRDPEHALTGPLARGDLATIETHLLALGARPESALYQAFLDFYRARQKDHVVRPEVEL